MSKSISSAFAAGSEAVARLVRDMEYREDAGRQPQSVVRATPVSDSPTSEAARPAKSLPARSRREIVVLRGICVVLCLVLALDKVGAKLVVECAIAVVIIGLGAVVTAANMIVQDQRYEERRSGRNGLVAPRPSRGGDGSTANVS
jgi:hypothetical protein